MFNMIPLPYRILAVFLIMFFVFTGGYLKGLSVGNQKLKVFEAESKAQYEQLRAAYEKAKNTVNERVVVKYVDKIVYVTKWRTKNVTITKLVPDTCELSNGWVHVHDSSTEGSDADPAAATDGTPSGIGAAQALETVVDNYGICAANTEKLKALQDWVRQQQIEVENLNKQSVSGKIER